MQQPIEVSINGARTLLPPATTLESVLKDSGYRIEFAAVAVNDSFVPREAYTSQVLRPGDRVEVLMPFSGG